jgi:hypothetical protein
MFSTESGRRSVINGSSGAFATLFRWVSPRLIASDHR